MKLDEFDLDFRLLHLFITIYDQGSVTAAASVLGVGQPTVSHGLERLRKIVGDPLFVRAGRGIIPTAHASEMAPRIRQMMEEMRSLTRLNSFDPTNPEHSLHCVIGANDYDVTVVLSRLFRRLQSYRANVSLRIRPVRSYQEQVAKLRDGSVDLTITADYRGDAGDIIQRALFDEDIKCYYDPAFYAQPPDTLDHYCAASHARIVFGDDESAPIDEILAQMGRSRRTVLQVSSFHMIPRLIAGTAVMATLPSRLADTVMAGFASCRCPLDIPSVQFYQSWHVRNASSAGHRWLRDQIFQIARSIANSGDKQEDGPRV